DLTEEERIDRRRAVDVAHPVGQIGLGGENRDQTGRYEEALDGPPRRTAPPTGVGGLVILVRDVRRDAPPARRLPSAAPSRPFSSLLECDLNGANRGTVPTEGPQRS